LQRNEAVEVQKGPEIAWYWILTPSRALSLTGSSQIVKMALGLLMAGGVAYIMVTSK
jgi:hypothetical protein